MAQIHTSGEAWRNGLGRAFSTALVLLAFAGLLSACSQSEPVAPRKADSTTPPPGPTPPPSPTPPPVPTPPPTADTTPPTAPGTLVAATDGPFGVTVSWQTSTDNVAVTGYKVERCTGVACTSFAQVATPTGTNFSDSGLNSSTSYIYRVRATDAAGNLSGYSNSANATTASALPPPVVTLPGWVPISVGLWTEIPNTSVRSVDPAATPAGNTGPRSKIDTWTSIVVDTRTSKVYSVAGGGHQDYAGNEVDMLDLETATPGWTELLAPTSSGQVSNCSSYYSDGRPASRHSYYGVTLNEFNDRFMLFGGVIWCTAGGFDNPVSSYNIAANAYSPSGTHAGLPSAYNRIAAYALNPLTGDVYAAANFNYGRWTRASGANGTFVVLNPSGNGPKGDSAGAAMDTTRGRILFLGGDNTNPDRHLYTISSNSFSSVTLSGASGDVSAVSNMLNAALLYVDALDAFLVKLDGSGGTVYQINAGNFAVSQLITTGGSSIPSTVSGVYNKFRYVPRLRGVIYTPTGNGNAWFLRIVP